LKVKLHTLSIIAGIGTPL